MQNYPFPYLSTRIVGKTTTIANAISWSSNSGVSVAHLWTDEASHLHAIIKEKDRVYNEQLKASTTAAKIKAEVTKILEPMWSQVRAKSKPALKQVLPRPTASPSFANPVAKVNTSRPCCVGCKKFQIHPNPPPHFTAEDMAHCCALCRLSSGKRHGDHCSKQKA